MSKGVLNFEGIGKIIAIIKDSTIIKKGKAKHSSPNEEVYKNMTNKKYICIVDDEHMVGSISEIEDWFNSNGFNDDVNDIIMYELKSDISVGCSFEYKTCIKII